MAYEMLADVDWRGILTGVAVTIIGAPVIWVLVRLGRYLVDLTGIIPATLIIKRETEPKGGLPGKGLGPLHYGQLSLTISRVSGKKENQVFSESLAPGDVQLVIVRPGTYLFVLTWNRRLAEPVTASMVRYLPSGRQEITVGLVSKPLGTDSVHIYGAPKDGLAVQPVGSDDVRLTIGPIGKTPRGRQAGWTIQ
jgi:hypothetical protein